MATINSGKIMQHEPEPQQAPDPIDLAELVLGQELGYTQPEDPELWDESRKIIYRATLRQLAQKRHEHRAQGHNVTAWTPDETQLSTMRAELHTPMGRLAMLNNAAQWEKGHMLEASSLREHQKPVIDNFLSFLRDSPTTARRANELELAGRFELPTGSGKSYLIQKIAAIVGVGKPVPYRGPLNGIALTSRANIRDQLIDLLKTEQPDVSLDMQFPAPDTAPSAMTLTNYSAMIFADKANPDWVRQTDIVFTDEIHNGIGDRTWPRVEKLSKNALLLAMTATPTLLQKDVRHIVPHLIAEGDLLAYIESGILNSLHLFTHSTGVDRTALSHSELMHHTGRNKLIVDLVAQCVEQGLQVYVSCLLGTESLHGRLLKELLDHTEVIDKVTGEARYINSDTTNSTKTNTAVNAIKQRYARGELDVLLDTATIQEGFDSERVGAIILASPTNSPAVLTQRLGRGLRYNKRRPVTVVHELIDGKTNTPARRLTCHHILREPEIRSERFVGEKRPSTNTIGFEDRVFGLGAVLGTISLDMVQKREPVPPQEGWVRVDQLLQLAERDDLQLRTPQLRYLIAKHTTFAYEIDKDGRGVYFVEPAAIEYVKQLAFAASAPNTHRTIVGLSAASGYSEWVLKRTAERLSVPGKHYRKKRTMKTAVHFSPEEQQQIIDELERYPAKGPDDFSLDELVNRVSGASRYTLFDYLNREGFAPSTRIRRDEKQTYIDPIECYSVKALRAAQDHFAEQLIPEEAVLLEALRTKLGIGQSAFNTHIKQLGLMDFVAIGKKKDGNSTARYVSHDIGEIIINSFPAAFIPDSSTKALPYYSKKFGINPQHIVDIIYAQGLNKYLHERPTAKSIRRTFADAGEAELESVLEQYVASKRGTRIAIKTGLQKLTDYTASPRPALEDLTAATTTQKEGLTVPVSRAAEMFGCTEQTLTKFLRKIQLNIDELQELGDGVVVLSADAYDTVRTYVSYLKPAPTDWLTIEEVSKKLGISKLDIVRRLGKHADYIITFNRVAADSNHLGRFIDPRHLHLIKASRD